jgi:2-polyprenyl-3-methyl-5-hydroxy-6-metoxy-1,4-benzoquinol methylase/glycosyltransferase involved in cell wall biosynthesis
MESLLTDLWPRILQRHHASADVRFLEITDASPLVSLLPNRPPWSHSLILLGSPLPLGVPLPPESVGRSSDEIVPQVFDEILIHFQEPPSADPVTLFYSLFRRGFIREKTFVSVIFPENAVSVASFRQAVKWLKGANVVDPSPDELVYAFLKMLRFRDIRVRKERLTGDTGAERNCDFLLAEGVNSDFAEFMHERYIPGTWTELSDYEHVPRYVIASTFASGKRVLDFGCGVGFGSFLLGEKANSVLAVDNSRDALQWADRFYRRSNLRFALNEDLGGSLPPASFDLVVCFEVVEHLETERQATLIENFCRLLTPDGLLLVSTPDPNATELYGPNPFHLAELRKNQFEKLLRDHFRFVAICEQKALPAIIFNGVTDGNPPACCSFEAPASKQEHCVLNWVAVCSNSVEVIAPSAAFIDSKSNVVRQRILSTRQINQLQLKCLEQAAQLDQLRAEIARYQSQIDALAKGRAESAERARQLENLLDDQIAQSAEKVDQLNEKIQHLHLAVYEAKRLSDGMRQSLSWRLTRPLRVLRDACVTTLKKLGSRDNPPLDTAPDPQESVGTADPDTAAVEVDPHATYLAVLIRESAFFDAHFYQAAAEARAQGLDPAIHYVLVGERRGLKPSPAFDPIYYADRYPDIAASNGNRLGHYLLNGRSEGRRALPIADTLTLPLTGIDPDKSTVLVLIHQASRTGAPILGWNIARALHGQVNTVVVLLQGGTLEGAFAEAADAVVCPNIDNIWNEVEGSRLAYRLSEFYRPVYAIANSVETRALVPMLTDQGVPVVALVHEFSSLMKPVGNLRQLYQQAAEIVFPAEIVRRASEADYPFLKLRHTHVLPQGKSEVPWSSVRTTDPEATEVRSRLRPCGAEDDLVIVGMGYIDWRKGIDLFIATATALLAGEPKAAVRFTWIGHGYSVSDTVLDVSTYLSEQITRSSLGDRLQLIDAVEDVESAYKEADVLFLSSRLDPLPNVSIDGALHGIPVVCFAEASGMAEILASNKETRELVVPHLDVAAAAALIGALAWDRDKLARLGQAVREVALKRFDMSAYVTTLHKLGLGAAQTVKQTKEAVDAVPVDASGS